MSPRLVFPLFVRLGQFATHRGPAFVAALVVSSSVLFYYKAALLLETAATSEPSLSHFVADGWTALLISLGVLIHERLRAALLYAAILLYVTSIHTLLIFGGLIDVVALSYVEGLADMRDNIRGLRWTLWLGAPLVMVVSWWLQRRLGDLFATRWRRRWALVAAVWFGLLLLVSALPRATQGDLSHHNPLGYLVRSVVFHLGETTETKSPATPFSPLSIYPSRPQVAPQVEPLDGRLNLVIVLLESTGVVTLGVDSQRVMPSFWRLAQNGVYFANFYANLPMSMKAIFALHSGWDPAANWQGISELRPRIPIVCLPAFFSRAGYRTALLHGGHFAFYKKQRFLADRGYDLLYDGHSIPNREAYAHSSWGIDDRAIFDFARQWIGASEQPFLLTLIPVLPHAPYLPPAGHQHLAKVNDPRHWYLTSVAYIDSLLGELIDELERQGRLFDTLWVVVGDHGEAFAQHPGNIVHGKEIYEENLRVPLVISNPRLFPSPQRNPVVGKLGDLLPTILQLTGLDTSDYHGDGMSLLRPQARRMVFFYTALTGEKLGLRDGDFKYILRRGPERSELFDLRHDPGERLNIALDHIERVAFYRQQVERWKHYSRHRIETYQGTATQLGTGR